MKYYDTSFDSQFDAIENLTWKPWVGKDYSNAEHKVLIQTGPVSRLQRFDVWPETALHPSNGCKAWQGERNLWSQ